MTIAGMFFIGLHNRSYISILPDGSATDESTLVVSGTVPEATLSIQGLPITGSPDGSFSHNVVLTPGYNEIRVVSTNQHGRTRSRTIRVIRTEEPPRFVRGDSVILNP